MTGVYLSPGLYPHELFQDTVSYILSVQRSSGEIPWFEGGHTDPWDHVEAAMALSIAGKYQEAERAYAWLADEQLPDGSWWARYEQGARAESTRRETNFCAYMATGVWHHFLITQDRAFLELYWPTVQQAMAFVLSLQTVHGDITWAVDDDNDIPVDSLVTGCASIYKSLECAHNIAVTLGHDTVYFDARERLGRCLRQHPERFDRTWESKARYSMDWFYPVLTGVFSGKAARERLQARWNEFVEPGMGCRCVSDEPWATIAETCELVLALQASDEEALAREVYSWIAQWRHDDGSYWTGYQFKEQVLWPHERPTWTAAAVMLAADALTQHTPAAQLFTHVNLLDSDNSVHAKDLVRA
ncbi:prenyltransferase [Aequoribacter sp.]|uniref:prenyltransferase n=1 Tax=Aequoribacter sp. TaxID=2847771 RepID=UPI003C416D62